MKNLFICTMVLAIHLFYTCAASAKGESPISEGKIFPDTVLASPVSRELKEYLGLSDQTHFKIKEIKAEVVIIEIFSMYCPHCQREAPTVNDFYRKIESDPELRGRVKLMGIGAGNSEYEIGFFKKKYQIPFPLFPDQDFHIHKIIGEVRTPYFIGIRIHGDGTPVIFYSKLGGPKDARKFLNELIERSGL
jgi:peroxiredoxin